MVMPPRSRERSNALVTDLDSRIRGLLSQVPLACAFVVQPVPANRSALAARTASTRERASAVETSPSRERLVSAEVIRCTRTRMSIRSRSGPEIRPR